jgi:tetratricopeptide (TPR) repeat protein
MQKQIWALALAFGCWACGPQIDTANWEKCQAGGDDRIAEVIAGCSAIIDAAREAPTRLGAAHGLRGSARLARKEFELALADADASVKLAPKWTPALSMRALVHFEMKNYGKAIADWDAAIEIAPKDALLYAQRGRAHKWAGHDKEAIDDFSIAVDLGLKHAGAFLDRGTIYARQNKFDEAIADFDSAIAITPDDPIALNNRCYVRALANVALDGALADCEKALALKAQPGMYDSRGLVHLRLGQLNEAITDFDTVLANDSNDAKALFQRGIAKRRNGDVAGGDADIAAATALKPGIADDLKVFGLTP